MAFRMDFHLSVDMIALGRARKAYSDLELSSDLQAVVDARLDELADHADDRSEFSLIANTNQIRFVRSKTGWPFAVWCDVCKVGGVRNPYVEGKVIERQKIRLPEIPYDLLIVRNELAIDFLKRRRVRTDQAYRAIEECEAMYERYKSGDT